MPKKLKEVTFYLLNNTKVTTYKKIINNTYYNHIFSNTNLFDENISFITSKLHPHHNNKVLFLNKNKLTDHAFNKLLDHLSNDTIVEHLILSHNNIQLNTRKNTLITPIKKNKTLRFLVLSHNKINNIGIKNLSNALEHNTNIKHLILSNNQISDEGFIYLLNKLTIQKTCKTLDLSHNLLTNSSLHYLIYNFNKLNFLKKININNNKFNDEQALNALKYFANQKQINIKSDYCFIKTVNKKLNV